MPAFASGTWDSPDLFDVALFKHSDHPVKLQLMDRACHSERPRQRGDNLVTCTHLSFVVERDIVCTGALVSVALIQALCELQRSQSCHLGLNNPRCHYLGHLSTPTPPAPPPTDTHMHTLLWPNNTHARGSAGCIVFVFVCVLYCVTAHHWGTVFFTIGKGCCIAAPDSSMESPQWKIKGREQWQGARVLLRQTVFFTVVSWISIQSSCSCFNQYSVIHF